MVQDQLPHLQPLQRLGVQALPVERHAGVAVQHGGALVDVRRRAKVVLRLPPLLLPEVYLPDAVPAGCEMPFIFWSLIMLIWNRHFLFLPAARAPACT